MPAFDPALNAFARDKVLVEIDPSVVGTGAVVQITDVVGNSYVERRAAPRGDAEDPLSPDDIKAKFRHCTLLDVENDSDCI